VNLVPGTDVPGTGFTGSRHALEAFVYYVEEAALRRRLGA
jgi:hypothetical protein